ncbi:hypothetical protein EVAR_80394_1 [Eumeta japonica]|uniref:Uncharacterized protein n=1 Tax=Eumeta variegata TaxID=151549 RepID=A0A4C1VIA0_EUMVA|nr:hypothetical protein EVAR_80394_1 [Eumeta japonica]
MGFNRISYVKLPALDMVLSACLLFCLDMDDGRSGPRRAPPRRRRLSWRAHGPITSNVVPPMGPVTTQFSLPIFISMATLVLYWASIGMPAPPSPSADAAAVGYRLISADGTAGRERDERGDRTPVAVTAALIRSSCCCIRIRRLPDRRRVTGHSDLREDVIRTSGENRPWKIRSEFRTFSARRRSSTPPLAARR